MVVCGSCCQNDRRFVPLPRRPKWHGTSFRMQQKLWLFFILFFAACVPPGSDSASTEAGEVVIDLRNKSVQQLFDLRDKRLADSLQRYFTHPEATLRYIAAVSFASMGDSTHIPALSRLLSDANDDVRIAAAFAMGQIGHVSAEIPLSKAFIAADSLSTRQKVNAVILEAIGKCGSLPNLKNIAAVTTYQPSDTLLLQGQCRAIYQYGIRRITTPAATDLMVRYCANEAIPEPARLMAAHYLARTEKLSPDSAQALQIAAAYVRAANPDIRMALALGLGKAANRPAFAFLSKVIQTEQDWRVQCNLIRAMSNFSDYDTVRSLITPLISNANWHVSRAAAEFFIQNGQPKDGDYYWRIAQNNPNLPIPTQIALFQAGNKWLPKGEIESKNFVVYRLKQIFHQTQSPYDRAACLSALAESPWQYRWIYEQGAGPTVHPAIKSAAAQVLTTITKRKDFYGIFAEDSKGVRREIYLFLREMILQGDPGMIAEGAEGLRSEILNYRTMRDTTRNADFSTALDRLKLPRDVEAYVALKATIAWLNDQPKPDSVIIKFNNPIDWNLLTGPAFAPKARITTNKGDIVLKLLPEMAPGSVANFVKLSQDGFFDKKNFHRVVANFVVQGGCPRGDGYGALDYSIRSEFVPVWYDQAGYVGMASADPDTEGTQWFITHSPTPHLDGRYSIFAQVISGMDVVERLQMGDLMTKVALEK
jgi:cyclophilin family peptidyl-prolyl cis-trans isomerase/HEAT repeat protein